MGRRRECLNKRLRESVPVVRAMFNRPIAQRTSHKCFATTPTSRCCHGHPDVLNKVNLAIDDMLCPAIRLGSAKPSKGKWFSIASRVRGMLLGIATHRLIPRAWLRGFANEVADAAARAREDLEDDSDDESRAAIRKRHLKATYHRTTS